MVSDLDRWPAVESKLDNIMGADKTNLSVLKIPPCESTLRTEKYSYAWHGFPTSTQDRVESKESGHVSFVYVCGKIRKIQREEKKGGTKQRTKNANTDGDEDGQFACTLSGGG